MSITDVLQPIVLKTIQLRNDGFEWAHLSATSDADITTIYKDLLYLAYPQGPEITMYISVPHASGLASFKCQTGNRMGYGGAAFELNMFDGGTERLVGPWSSRESVVNQLTGRQLVSIAINGLAVSIDRAVLEPQLLKVNPEWQIEQEIGRDGEISYSLPVRHAPPQRAGGKPTVYSI